MGSMKRIVMLACSNVMAESWRCHLVQFCFMFEGIYMLTPWMELRVTGIRSIDQAPQTMAFSASRWPTP